jgi:multidrug efflux pump subunit AcrA (membrane-fusion protein)
MNGYDGFVYLLDPDGQTARRTPVRIGRLFNDTVGIVQGLEQGDQVITTGAPYLEDGDRVDVVHEPQHPNEAVPSLIP